MAKTAIILGATGVSGSILLTQLLADNRYNKIILFTRSNTNRTNPKIEEYKINLLQLENYAHNFKGDEVFCCIGTTNAKTPNKELYHKIDYGIPVSAAKLCQRNKISTLIIVSALGADSKSRVFYNRTKGEMENAVLDCNIPNTYLLQPSLISGPRKEKRIGELIMKGVAVLLNPLLVGPLKKYRSIRPESIVSAMIWLANNTYQQSKRKGCY